MSSTLWVTNSSKRNVKKKCQAHYESWVDTRVLDSCDALFNYTSTHSMNEFVTLVMDDKGIDEFVTILWVCDSFYEFVTRAIYPFHLHQYTRHEWVRDTRDGWWRHWWVRDSFYEFVTHPHTHTFYVCTRCTGVMSRRFWVCDWLMKSWLLLRVRDSFTYR